MHFNITMTFRISLWRDQETFGNYESLKAYTRMTSCISASSMCIPGGVHVSMWV